MVLMGGGSSRNTTEIVRQDGSVEMGFDLVLDTWCVENLPSTASAVSLILHHSHPCIIYEVNMRHIQD